MSTRTPARKVEASNRYEAVVGRAQPPPPPDRSTRVGTPTPHADLPGLGRSVAIATAATMLVVLVAVTVACLVAGHPLASSLGVGAVGALWGGGAFGAMIGGVVHVHRTEQSADIPSLVGSDRDLSPALQPAWPSTTPIPGGHRLRSR